MSRAPCLVYQQPGTGSDPEFTASEQVLAEVRWMHLAEIPERDRAFLWAAGLLSIPGLMAEVEGWGDQLSHPEA